MWRGWCCPISRAARARGWRPARTGDDQERRSKLDIYPLGVAGLGVVLGQPSRKGPRPVPDPRRRRAGSAAAAARNALKPRPASRRWCGEMLAPAEERPGDVEAIAHRFDRSAPSPRRRSRRTRSGARSRPAPGRRSRDRRAVDHVNLILPRGSTVPSFRRNVEDGDLAGIATSKLDEIASTGTRRAYRRRRTCRRAGTALCRHLRWSPALAEKR